MVASRRTLRCSTSLLPAGQEMFGTAMCLAWFIRQEKFPQMLFTVVPKLLGNRCIIAAPASAAPGNLARFGPPLEHVMFRTAANRFLLLATRSWSNRILRYRL